MNSIEKEQILKWLEITATILEKNKDYLTELDAAIGDADHGINMNRGFQKVKQQLTNLADRDIETILKTVSMTLISTMGGASGPLYGTFFFRASMAVKGKSQLDAQDAIALLQAGLDGVIQRGKAKLGDKTMVDTLIQGVDTFKEAISSGQDLVQGLTKAVDAAEVGMKSTSPLVAKKGRASYLGDRSVGHQDPGATSSYLLLKSLLESVR